MGVHGFKVCVRMCYVGPLLTTAGWHHRLRSKLYGQSKLGNLFVSNIFAQSYPGRIVSTSVHPGGIETELQRHLEGGISGWISGALLGLILFPAP